MAATFWICLPHSLGSAIAGCPASGSVIVTLALRMEKNQVDGMHSDLYITHALPAVKVPMKGSVPCCTEHYTISAVSIFM